jgi:hypothetical protein
MIIVTVAGKCAPDLSRTPCVAASKASSGPALEITETVERKHAQRAAQNRREFINRKSWARRVFRPSSSQQLNFVPLQDRVQIGRIDQWNGIGDRNCFLGGLRFKESTV